MKNINDLLQVLNIADATSLIDFLKAYYENVGFTWMNEEIVGLRMDDNYTDTCSDWFLIRKGDNVIAIQGTTKPGSYWLNQKKGGTQKEGQVIGMWTIDVHVPGWSGLPYLDQKQPCTCYRDHSLLGYIDRNTPQETGIFYDNFHSWANIGESEHVGNLSEMCQAQDPEENTAAFEVINTFDDPKNITYALIKNDDFISYCQANQNS